MVSHDEFPLSSVISVVWWEYLIEDLIELDCAFWQLGDRNVTILKLKVRMHISGSGQKIKKYPAYQLAKGVTLEDRIKRLCPGLL